MQVDALYAGWNKVEVQLRWRVDYLDAVQAEMMHVLHELMRRVAELLDLRLCCDPWHESCRWHVEAKVSLGISVAIVINLYPSYLEVRDFLVSPMNGSTLMRDEAAARDDLDPEAELIRYGGSYSEPLDLQSLPSSPHSSKVYMRQCCSLLRLRLSTTSHRNHICGRITYCSRSNYQRQTFATCTPLCRFQPVKQTTDPAMTTTATKTGQPFDRPNFESLMTRRFFYKLSYRYYAPHLPLDV